MLRIKFRDSLKYLLENRIYLFVIFVISTASFGFAITHFSMGIDDFGAYHYLDLSSDSFRNMLQQGRLSHIIFYYVLGVADVIPFLNNFIGVVLLVFSCIICAALVRSLLAEHVTDLMLCAFSCVYISCSIISFKFIYDIDVVVTMFSYLMVPISIYYGLKYIEQKKKCDYLLGVIFCVLAISSYESFICVFVCQVLFLLSLEYIYSDDSVSVIMKKGMTQATILTAALVMYYSTVTILQYITGNTAFVQTSILNANKSLIDIGRAIIFRWFSNDLFFVKEFSAFVILFILLMLYFVFYRKKYFCLVLFPAIGLFTIAISILQTYVYYRTGQTINIFLAFITIFLLKESFAKRILYSLNVIILSLVILWQVKDINGWFYLDWINYQKNVYAIHEIARDLYRDFDVETKPVCFVNRDYTNPLLMTWNTGVQEEIGESALIAAVGFLGDMTSPAVLELFEYQGYDFIIEPDEEQVKEALEIAEDMEAYPKEGYIQECEDFIVVNFGLN